MLLRKKLVNQSFCKKCREFEDGLKAWAAISTIDQEEALPRLILLDINMPIMDAWGFLDKIQKHPLHMSLFICIITSSIDYRDREKAQVYPQVRACLTKPIDLNQLIHLRESI